MHEQRDREKKSGTFCETFASLIFVINWLPCKYCIPKHHTPHRMLILLKCLWHQLARHETKWNETHSNGIKRSTCNVQLQMVFLHFIKDKTDKQTDRQPASQPTNQLIDGIELDECERVSLSLLIKTGLLVCMLSVIWIALDTSIKCMLLRVATNWG